MKIFIDFDDTLFNTKDFSSEYKKVFSTCGVCKDIFQELYYDYPQKEEGKLLKYDSQKHIERIGEECQMDVGELKSRVDELIKNTRKYIFSDSRNFLDNFRKNDLVLVSYGKTQFQKNKIMHSGIAKYFGKIILTDDMKSKVIKKFLKPQEAFYFMDDRVEQVEDVKIKLPLGITFFVKRPEGRFDDERNQYCDFEIKNLSEALDIIKK